MTRFRKEQSSRETLPALGAVVTPSAIRTASSFVVAFLLAFCLIAPSNAHAQPTPTYELEIGNAVILPGQGSVLIPVFMTNSEEVTSWSTGLDYDQFQVHVVRVTADDTASMPLLPVINTTPSAPPLQYVQMIYPNAPLAPGVHQLVAYLECSTPVPAASTTTVDITPLETGINGTGANQVGGSLTVIVGNALVVGTAAGGVADEPHGALVTWPAGSPNAGPNPNPLSPVRLPVQLWNTDPVSRIVFTKQPGLDYDQYGMQVGVDLHDTICAQVAGSSASVSIFSVNAMGGAAYVVEIDLGTAVLPPSDGEVVAWLSLVPTTPVAGVFDVSLSSGQLTSGGIETSVTNLLNGRVVFLDHFVRGDVEFDRSLNLSDAAALVEAIWMGGQLACPDAADLNDDDAINVADLVQLLSYIFSATPMPAEPFPKSGVDPTDLDTLPCL